MPTINTKDALREHALACNSPVDFWMDPQAPSSIISTVCADRFLEDPFFGRLTTEINQTDSKYIRIAQEDISEEYGASTFTTCNGAADNVCPTGNGVVDEVREALIIRDTCSLDHCDLAEIHEMFLKAGNDRDKLRMIDPLVKDSAKIIDRFVTGKEKAIKSMIYSGILTGSSEVIVRTDAGNQIVQIQDTGIAQLDWATAGLTITGGALWNNPAADPIGDIIAVNNTHFNSCSGCNLAYLTANSETVKALITAIAGNAALCCENQVQFLTLSLQVRHGELFQLPIPNFPPILVVDSKNGAVKDIPDGSVIFVSDCEQDSIFITDAKNMDASCSGNSIVDVPGQANIGSVITSECFPNPRRVGITHSWSGLAYFTKPQAFVHALVF